MLFNQKTNLLFDQIINPLLITDSMLHFHNTEIVCSDIDNNLCIMSYEEAKSRKLQIVAKFRFSFEPEKLITFQNCLEGHHHKYYHGTFPILKRVLHSNDSSSIISTTTKTDIENNILEKLITK